ncbi:MAG: AIR synthase related protein, partial [Verrucomicrobia bacterium]|nr:AIR synthase related protein [Verrucomicrobiota bacterium]
MTGTGQMVVKKGGVVVADICARRLADEAPVYDRTAREPDYFVRTRSWTPDQVADLALTDISGSLNQILAWPTLASKNWVYRQYDHMVRNGSVVVPGSDSAVIRIKQDSMPVRPGGEILPFPEKFIAMTVDGNGIYTYLDPREGGKIAVAEAARNIAASGAHPIGVTDNLNFGNPHHPDLFFQLKEAILGLSDACHAFQIPVTGGNVSLYNQSPMGAIDPTPVVGVVGLYEDASHITTQWFKKAGHVLLLVEPAELPHDPWHGLGGSAYVCPGTKSKPAAHRPVIFTKRSVSTML